MITKRLAARQLIVRGKVQGVFYRKSTQEKAGELKLKGWVRNRRDGSVEIWAEGSAEALDTLYRWCGRGPYEARVDFVEQETTDSQGFDTFEVRETI